MISFKPTSRRSSAVFFIFYIFFLLTRCHRTTTLDQEIALTSWIFDFFFTQMDDTDHSEYKVVLALTQKTDRFFITFTHNVYAGIKQKHERNNLGV